MQNLSKQSWPESLAPLEPSSDSTGSKPVELANHTRLEPRFWILVGLSAILYLIGSSIGSGWTFLECAAVATILLFALVLSRLSLAGVKLRQIHPTNANA